MPANDFQKNVFSPETYKVARISQPDPDTLVADGVRGTPLKVVITRKLDDWGISVRVVCYLKDDPEQKGIPVVVNYKADDDFKAFWRTMKEMVHRGDDEEGQRNRERAVAILNGDLSKEPTPKKGRK